MQAIDFTQCKKFHNEIFFMEADRGDKIYADMFYGDGVYSLKYGEHHEHECFSEYIGCRIFSILGIPAQDTLLGFTEYKGKRLIAVAGRLTNVAMQCSYNWKSMFRSHSNNEDDFREISNFMTVMSKIQLPGVADLLSNLWRIIVVDAYIGNYSRGNGYDAGFLVGRDKKYSVASVSGCEQCLYARMLAQDATLIEEGNAGTDFVTDDKEQNIISEKECFLTDGKPLFYHDYFQQLEDVEGLKALVSISMLIMDKEEEINRMIDEAPIISEKEKLFYKSVLHQRWEKILVDAMEKNPFCQQILGA